MNRQKLDQFIISAIVLFCLMTTVVGIVMNDNLAITLSLVNVAMGSYILYFTRNTDSKRSKPEINTNAFPTAKTVLNVNSERFLK